MTDYKDQVAKKLQAAARGYIVRKTGVGKKKAKKSGGKHKQGKSGKKKPQKTEDMAVKIIQSAYKKYQKRNK